MLLEADEICRENDIRYALFGATALRAHARHCFGDNEDSVVKIAMIPRDAMRFVEAVEREARPDRYIEYLGNNPEVGRINVRYGNRNTIDFVPADTAAFKNFGIYIEVILLRYDSLLAPVRLFEHALLVETEYQVRLRTGRSVVRAFCGVWKHVKSAVGPERYAAHLLESTASDGLLRDKQNVVAKQFGRKNKSYLSCWFTDLDECELEGHLFFVPRDTEEYLEKEYGEFWEKRAEALENRGHREGHIYDIQCGMDTWSSESWDGDMVGEYKVQRARLMGKRVRSRIRSARNGRAWARVRRSAMRYKLWEEYEPQRALVLDLAAKGADEELGNVLAHYLRILEGYVKRGYVPVFDEDIFDVAVAWLWRNGEKGKAVTLRALRPLSRDWPIEIDVGEYMDWETTALREAKESNLERIREFVARDISKCIYMYLDVNQYGLDNPNMKLWILTSVNTKVICGVAMRYHDSISLVTNGSVQDLSPFVELIEQQKPTMVSGDLDLIKAVSESCSIEYDLEEGYVYDITDYRVLDGEADIQPALDSEMREIAQLICSDESIGSYYDVDDLEEQLRTRKENGTGRNFVIREDGVIFAHIATYAEGMGIGVTAGLIVDEQHRDKPYGTFLESYLVDSMRKDGLRAFTFVTNRKRARLFDAMGGKLCGRYGKMTR